MQNKLIKFIAANQIIGGALGVPLLIYLAWQLFQANPTLWEIQEARVYFIVFYGCIGLIFLAAIFAGISLYRGQRKGLWLSRFIQLVQIPSFTLAHVSYFLGIGLNLFTNFTFKASSIGFHISTNFPLNFNIATVDNVSNGFTLGFNLVALFCSYILVFSKYKNDIA